MSSSPPTDDATNPVIGILACDHVQGDVLVEAARGRDYADMYADMLRSAAPELRIRVYDVVAGELPADPAECDGWIITGARYDSYRDDPWIEALRELVRRLHAHRARTVGVCFGHQLAAHALGGRAAPAGEWKAGPHTVAVEPTEWFEGGEVSIHAMHQDVVVELPPGARTIGAGATAAHPVYVVGDSLLGIQDHPEYDASYISALIESRRARMGDEVTDAALGAVEERSTDNDVVARWIVDFLLDRRRDVS